MPAARATPGLLAVLVWLAAAAAAAVAFAEAQDPPPQPLQASGLAYTLSVSTEGEGGEWAAAPPLAGVRLRLRAPWPLLVDGGLPVHEAEAQQVAALDGSVRVRCRGGRRFERLVDAAAAETEVSAGRFALFPALQALGGGPSAAWMSLFEDLGPPDEPRGPEGALPLDLHLVARAGPASAPPPRPEDCVVELVRGPGSSLTGPGGAPLWAAANVTAESRHVVSHDVSLRRAGAPGAARFQTTDNAFGGREQGGAAHAARPHVRAAPREQPPTRYFEPDPKRRLRETYASFVQADGPDATALDRAVDTGWRLHTSRREEPHLDPAVLLETRGHMESHGSAVAAGMIMGVVVENFAAEAIRMATSKTNELFDNHLEPLFTDALSGHAPGGDAAAAFLEEQVALRQWPGARGRALVEDSRLRRRHGLDGAFVEMAARGGATKRGMQGDEYGVLAVGVAEDLIKMVPDMVEQISSAFSSMASADLHASLTESVEHPLEEAVLSKVAEWVGTAVPETVEEVVSPAVERLLPDKLVQQVDRTMVETLTRALAHSLTHTLTHTLTRTPDLEKACYECHYFQKQCHLCLDGRDEHVSFVHAYYAHYYSAFYGDYYADAVVAQAYGEGEGEGAAQG